MEVVAGERVSRCCFSSAQTSRSPSRRGQQIDAPARLIRSPELHPRVVPPLRPAPGAEQAGALDREVDRDQLPRGVADLEGVHEEHVEGRCAVRGAV